MSVGIRSRWGSALWEWVSRPWHYRGVGHLNSAARAGDVERLRSLLAPTVAVVVAAGDDPAAVRVIHGSDDAAVLLAHGFAPKGDLVVEERSVNSQAGLMMSRSGSPIATIAVDFTGRLISLVWVRLDPAALRHWNTVYA
jgi:hypothetical protein